jgi:uncharacterized protein YlzI (FlbEa/FlbD family)
MLNPNLSGPLLVLHKLEREMYRAFHHQNYVHKSDHLYNFCITALSLKDYVLHFLRAETKVEKEARYGEWAKTQCLLAATEIANTAKHCVLSKIPKTQELGKTKSSVIDVYVDGEGNLKSVESNVPDYKVTLGSGKEIYLYEFTNEIIEYWKEYLTNIGIEYVSQDEDVFFGET